MYHKRNTYYPRRGVPQGPHPDRNTSEYQSSKIVVRCAVFLFNPLIMIRLKKIQILPFLFVRRGVPGGPHPGGGVHDPHQQRGGQLPHGQV